MNLQYEAYTKTDKKTVPKASDIQYNEFDSWSFTGFQFVNTIINADIQFANEKSAAKKQIINSQVSYFW